MVRCSTCDKILDKVPAWLTSAKVEFVCNNCPNRHTKNITQIALETPVAAKADDEDSFAEPEAEEEDES